MELFSHRYSSLDYLPSNLIFIFILLFFKSSEIESMHAMCSGYLKRTFVLNYDQELPKALLEDQLGTLIQKMIVAKAPSCSSKLIIISCALSFARYLKCRPELSGKEVYLLD